MAFPLISQHACQLEDSSSRDLHVNDDRQQEWSFDYAYQYTLLHLPIYLGKRRSEEYRGANSSTICQKTLAHLLHQQFNVRKPVGILTV